MAREQSAQINTCIGTRSILRRFPDGVRLVVVEDPMRRGNRYGTIGMSVAVLLLMGLSPLVSACNTVAGAGQDVSAIGNTVTSGAVQTKKATGAP